MSLVTATNRILQSSGRIMKNSGLIIKDASLTYWYDPSRTISYPGEGDDMFDLSGNNFHVRMNGGPVFTGNSFICSNIGDLFAGEIYFPFQEWGTYGGTYDLTITVWFKSSQASRFHPLHLAAGGGNFDLDINDTDGDSTYKTMWVYWNSAGSPSSSLPIGALGGHGPQSDLVTGTWQCYTFRRDINTAPYTEHFVNGVKVGGIIHRLSDQVESVYYGGTLQIGSVNGFEGELGSCHAYTRPLTDAEIMHNYNVEKSRFTD